MSRHSLKNRKAIQGLLNSGKKYTSSLMTIFLDNRIPEFNDDYRVAFLVSKKSGNAVERNRIKRWLREDFRKLQDEQKTTGAFVISFKGQVNGTNHSEVSSALGKLYGSIKTDG